MHPRIGAADVVPFVPVSGLSLAQCAMLARQAGLEIWRRYGVPVYFYEAAAARPDRVLLEDVRRGFSSRVARGGARTPSRRPDVGGPEAARNSGRERCRGAQLSDRLQPLSRAEGQGGKPRECGPVRRRGRLRRTYEPRTAVGFLV